MTERGGFIEVGKAEPVVESPEGGPEIRIGADAKTIYGPVRAEGQAPCPISMTVSWRRLAPGN